jgi:hypothetical protein
VSPVAFSVKGQLGHVAYSSATGAGSFLPGGGSEVVVHPAASIELLSDVGSDGFVLLLTLATLARPDAESRLVVEGGMERVRVLLGWGREKSSRVFREVSGAGFVLREQDTEVTATGRPRFSATRLVLDPGLYQPSAAASAGTATADTTQREDRPGGSPADGPSGGGKPDSAEVSPAGGADGVSGTTKAAPMMNDSSDDLIIGDQERRLVAALAALGFSDAAEQVATVERDVLERSLRYVAENLGALERPGAYLRKLLRTGGPPPEGAHLGEQLRAALTPDGSPPAAGQGEAPAPLLLELPEPAPDGPDPGELERRLAALDPAVRERLEQQADAAVESFRMKNLNLPAPAVRAVRNRRLAELLDLPRPDDEGSVT